MSRRRSWRKQPGRAIRADVLAEILLQELDHPTPKPRAKTADFRVLGRYAGDCRWFVLAVGLTYDVAWSYANKEAERLERDGPMETRRPRKVMSKVSEMWVEGRGWVECE